MKVRAATINDADALAVVHVRTWRVAYRGEVPQEYLDGLDRAQRRQTWEQWLRNDHPPAETLVLQHHVDGVIGYIKMSPGQDADSDPLTIGAVNAIYLLPAYWGRGGGRMLMDAGLRRLADAGYREATLWVLETNQRARRFYEAGGWHVDGSVQTDDSFGFPLVEVRYRHRIASSIKE